MLTCGDEWVTEINWNVLKSSYMIWGQPTLTYIYIKGTLGIYYCLLHKYTSFYCIATRYTYPSLHSYYKIIRLQNHGLRKDSTSLRDLGPLWRFRDHPRGGSYSFIPILILLKPPHNPLLLPHNVHLFLLTSNIFLYRRNLKLARQYPRFFSPSLPSNMRVRYLETL